MRIVCEGSARRRVSVEDSAAVCANVDSPIQTRIAGDLEDQAPLMLVVVDSDPGTSFINGAEDAGLTVNRSGEVEGRIGMIWSGFAKAESVYFFDSREAYEGDGRIRLDDGLSGAVKAIEGR